MDQGCHHLCLLDVDAARSKGHNRELISRIMHRFRQPGAKVCIQVGGGIRSSDQAQFFLDQGATWLLVGTILHRSPLIVDQLLARFSEYLTAAIDARAGFVKASGWDESSPITPEEQYQAGFSSAQPVTGLGDKARCNEAPSNATIKVSTLMVLAQNRVLQVVADTCATAIAFGKIAVPRL